MSHALTRRDVAWGYVAQFMNLAGGLLLLPVLLLRLSPQEVGLWFVFLTMVSLAQLIELGLQPTLARNAAYVYAGASDLRSQGLGKPAATRHVDLTLLRQLFVAGRDAYRLVAFVVAAILVIGGSAYVSHLESLNPDGLTGAVSAWVAYALGFVVAAYFGYFNAFILGRGDIAQNNKIVVVTKGGFIVIAAVAVFAGAGLAGLGAASLLSSAASRLLAYRYYRAGLHPDPAGPSHDGARRHLLAMLWPNVWRLSLVQLGAFLVVRANTLIAASFLSLAVVGSYGVTIQLLLAISGIGSLLVTLQMPRMNAAQVRNDYPQLRKALGLAVVTAWAIFGVGALVIVLFGNPLLELLGKSLRLVDGDLLAALLMIAFLEMNHSVAAMYLTTLNQVPFAGAAVISGVLIACLGTVLCGVVGWGLWGLVVAPGLVQLCYNNWKWPVEALRHVGLSPTGIVKAGILELRHVFGAR
jgi:O-antigen/teichoic acid export membrane protein